MEELQQIILATQRLFSKLDLLNPHEIEISQTSKDYLTRYIQNGPFYKSVYSQLLQKVFRKLKKPLTESVFIDYGGGCGILSFLARELGFRTVIYNDINEKSLNDALAISRSLGFSIDYYIKGDAEEFVNALIRYNIYPDIICSFDVLEHIYDLSSWIRHIARLSGLTLLSMTSANPKNPYIVCKLKKLHKLSEYHGYEKNIRNGDKYSDGSFLKEREIIIRNKFPILDDNEVKLLSVTCRGLKINEIEKVVTDYISDGEIKYKMCHPTNTCDPYTGSWTERLIDLENIKTIIENNNMKADYTVSYYSYSRKRILNLVKILLNFIIKISGSAGLYLSPTVTLEMEKSPEMNL